eukprot:COSAG03_NODE_1919_length_3353_cov_32.836816_4_plen_141_part_00
MVHGEDQTEYDRQRKYIKNHPGCESVPPKGIPQTDTRITVSRGEDQTEYERQRSYIMKHPDCESVPQRERRLSAALSRTNHPPKRVKRAPIPPKDTRITMSRGEDQNEYDRQRMYIKNHPGCESVPPKGIPQKDTRITVS